MSAFAGSLFSCSRDALKPLVTPESISDGAAFRIARDGSQTGERGLCEDLELKSKVLECFPHASVTLNYVQSSI